MMYTQIYKLLPHFFSLCFRNFLRFCIRTSIMHTRYRTFFFAGLFLHFIFKWTLWLSLDIQFPVNYNLALLCLSIYLATVIDINYFIYLSLHKCLMFTLDLWAYAPKYKYYGTGWVYPLSIWLVRKYVKDYDKEVEPENLGSTKRFVDQYYILRIIWLFFLSIRYWIIREPILFTVINITVFINFLQDHNRWLLFLYLLCIQLSRFMFFMGSEYERFNYKRWFNEWIIMGTKVNYYFDFRKPNLYQSGPFIPRSGLIFKYTWTNLNLAWFYNTRYEKRNPGFAWIEQQEDIDNWNRSFRYVKLSAIYDYWATKAFRIYEHRFHMDIWYDHEFSELRWWWGMRLYKDIQKFVKCNQMFWLAILILIIYIEL